jgi:hypothetical protein
MQVETWEIKGHTLEYIDATHQYICDGVLIPSITQIMKVRFGGKYDGIPQAVLNNAAKKGTEVHEAIETYCKTGEVKDLLEVNNFIFLQRQYKFEVLENEVPIILFKSDKPIAAGRLDLVLRQNGVIGGGDIKRTSKLDKKYLEAQLNLYRIGYRQCYGIEWQFLKGLHLRENVRRFVDLPINENLAWSLIDEYMREEKEQCITS